MTNPEHLIAIGDIHGCCRTIDALLEKLGPYEGYPLVFIGDYIDRGPCSKEVVSRMLELQKERECVFLRGNHEQMLLDAVDHGKVTQWLQNGGDATLSSYGLSAGSLDFPGDHMEYYRNTKIYYQTDNYFFVHAGLPTHQTIEQSLQDPDNYFEFLWMRDHLNVPETPWEKTVVFGHTPLYYPLQRPNMIGIDTGCVFATRGYGKLTALLLPEEIVIQQTSLDNH